MMHPLAALQPQQQNERRLLLVVHQQAQTAQPRLQRASRSCPSQGVVGGTP